MGERAIQAGDLVYVQTACCARGLADLGGYVLRVTRVTHEPWHCQLCPADGVEHVAQWEGCDFDEAVPVAWLKRIPPLSELQSIDTVTEIEREQKVTA